MTVVGNFFYITEASKIQPQLRSLRPAEGGGGKLRAILGQTHFAAGDVEHLRNLFGENALAAHAGAETGDR